MVRRSVLVGVDGSTGSTEAARYAAGLARRRGVPLSLVHGYLHMGGYGSLGWSTYAPAMPGPRADAQAMLDKLAADLRTEFAGLDVQIQQVAAGGAWALIDLSHAAEAVVVGHRGLGGFAELILGSVGSQVVAHASGPVVVVRPRQASRSDAPVVVGIDGSPGSAAAVEFAFEEAASRALPLVAACVYPNLMPEHEGSEPATEAESTVDTALAPWVAKYPDVEVRRHVVAGDDAGQVLVTLSTDADLVVVGSRGRGGFGGLLLGSVSQALVHHAHSPIAVVHPRQETSADS